MRMRDLPEAEEPEIDARMLEFVERRREEQAHARRQRIQLIAIIALGVIAVVLTVFNAVLVNRLMSRPAMPAAVNPSPPVRSTAPTQRAEPSDRALSEPDPLPPEPQESPVSTSALAEPPVSRPAPDSPAPSQRASTPAPSMPTAQPPSVTSEPPALPEPGARASRSAVSDQPRPGTRDMPAPVDTDPALRMARSMIRTYGPLDAESRALAASQFYTGGERAFWRRVVSHVRAER